MEKEKPSGKLLSKIPWKKLDKSQWLIVLLVGVLLLVIALPVDKGEEKQETSIQQQTDTGSAGRWDDYQDRVEKQLEEMLAQVNGVGRVKVMVTLAGTGELVVEKDVPQSQSQTQEDDGSGGSRSMKESTWEEATVYVQQDGDSTPYVVKELAPDIEGVCIIAQGGDNAVVAKNISEAVQALFPIEIHKIKVMKMK